MRREERASWKTVDEIYREMADRFAQETGMELAGTGEMAVRLYALAARSMGLYQESAWTRRQCFPQTATGEELDKHGALRGITRNGASKAAGSLRFSIQAAGTEDLPIPQGTVCMTAGLVAFETTQAGVLEAGQTQVDLPAQAVEAGPGGNVPAGTIRTMAVAPTGIAACTNPAAFTGGRRRRGTRPCGPGSWPPMAGCPTAPTGLTTNRRPLAVEGGDGGEGPAQEPGAGNGGRGDYRPCRDAWGGPGGTGPRRCWRTSGRSP